MKTKLFYLAQITLMNILFFILWPCASYSQANCQNEQISGKYLLLKDSDGRTPKKGASISLDLSGNSAFLIATMPGENVESAGRFFACNNLITIAFDEIDMGAEKQAFSLTGNTLVLPFLVLGGEGKGTSVWQKMSDKDLTEDEGEGEETEQDTREDTDESVNEGDEDQNNKDNNNEEKGNKDKTSDGENDKPGKNQENYGIKPPKEYVGDYYGTGRGWEVRFKHTSGEFVSQFTGKKGELPFGNDKVIMSLLVEHATSFKISIDENGNVTGDGEIVYNLVPNLCGVAMLTEQVNSAVNLMGEFAFFLDLSSKIGQASVAKFEGTFLGMEGQLAKTMKNIAETGLNLGYEYLGTKLPEKMKALDLEAQQSTALCNCATGQASIKGGNAVGPATLKELVSTFGVDVAKALFMDVATGSLPVGLILSIPGVTQIQYYYKGLQNGPETRRFDIKGKLVDGKLYLEMDGNVYDGPKNLTVEYMVNYKKETPTFPTWSPFLQGAATMYPSGTTATIYEQVSKTRIEKFKDVATGQTKSIEIPYTETTEIKETLPFPFASFREAGKQRNGVKVWHEYEYNWSVYKVPDSK